MAVPGAGFKEDVGGAAPGPFPAPPGLRTGPSTRGCWVRGARVTRVQQLLCTGASVPMGHLGNTVRMGHPAEELLYP